ANYDPVEEAKFRAVTGHQQAQTERQINLLWKQMGKRREEIQAVANRMNGIVWSAAAFMLALIISMVRAKIGL
ncbi:MAG: hypothetical protein P8Y47_05735, partial [Alphaproteobacteria bacterium]